MVSNLPLRNEQLMALHHRRWLPRACLSTIASRNTTTLFKTLMQKGLIDRSRLWIYFCKEFSKNRCESRGILTLGGDKSEHFVDGNLTWIPMSQEIVYQVWRAPLKAISGSHLRSDTNEISSSTVALSLARVIFDTGSGSLSLSEAIKGEAYAAIGFNWTAILSGAHIPRCTEFNSSWAVTFDFGERDDAEGRHAVRLDGAQLARPGFAGREEFCYPPFDSRGSYRFGLFGTPLLRQFYSVWDFGAMDVAGYAPRVRFGKLKADMRP